MLSFLFQNHCETFWKTLIQNVYRIEAATWSRESFVSSLFDVHELSFGFGDLSLIEPLDIVVDERQKGCSAWVIFLFQCLTTGNYHCFCRGKYMLQHRFWSDGDMSHCGQHDKIWLAN